MVQLSCPYVTTGRTITLTRQNLCWQSDVSVFQSQLFMVIDFSSIPSIRIYSQIFQNSVNVSALGTQNNHKTISCFSEQRKKHRGQSQTDFGFTSTCFSTGAHALFYQVSSEPRPSWYYQETSANWLWLIHTCTSPSMDSVYSSSKYLMKTSAPNTSSPCNLSQLQEMQIRANTFKRETPDCLWTAKSDTGVCHRGGS